LALDLLIATKPSQDECFGLGPEKLEFFVAIEYWNVLEEAGHENNPPSPSKRKRAGWLGTMLTF